MPIDPVTLGEDQNLMVKLAIGVITFNRLSRLQQTLAAIAQNTVIDYDLVVADDGSSDGTKAFCCESGIACVGGANRGIAWNKNRALFVLAGHSDATTIILLEDDTMPVDRGWAQLWMRAADRCGYVTYAHPKVRDAVLSGTGTPDDPYACTKITSQCAALSLAAFNKVGYLDTRFRGYGVEDGEWTTRMRREGFGILKVSQPNGGYIKANAMIDGGVSTADVQSWRDNGSVARNRELFARIRNEPTKRLPWRDYNEKSILESETQSVEVLGRLRQGGGGSKS